MKNKKLFAILTLVCFMMTLMPVAAFAAIGDDIQIAPVVGGTPGTPADSLKVDAGDTFRASNNVTASVYYYLVDEDGVGVTFADASGDFTIKTPGKYEVYAVKAVTNVTTIVNTATMYDKDKIALIEANHAASILDDYAEVKVNSVTATHKIQLSQDTAGTFGTFGGTYPSYTLTALKADSGFTGPVLKAKLTNGAGTKEIKGAELTYTTNSGYVKVQKIDTVTDKHGDALFKISATKAGTYQVTVKYAKESVTLNVTVSKTDVAGVSVVEEPTRPLALDTPVDGYTGIQFKLTDANGVVITGTDGTAFANSGLLKVAVIEQPADADLTGLDLEYDEDERTWVLHAPTTAAFDEEGKYTFKVTLANGASATASVKVAEFDEPVAMNLTYKTPTISLNGGTADVKALMLIDKNGTMKPYQTVSGYNFEFVATGKAVASVVNGAINDGRVTTVPTASMDSATKNALIGTTINVMAICEELGLTANAELLVAADPTALKYVSTEADVAVNNTLVVNTVDATGNIVKIGDLNTTTGANADNVYVYVLDAPENAVYDIKADIDTNNRILVDFTASTAGEYRVQLAVAVNDGSGNIVKYLSTVDTITVGGVVDNGTKSVIVLSIGSKNMINNGEVGALLAAPEIKDGRTMVPMRAGLEAFGATVNWNEADKTITAEMNGTTVVMTLDSKTYTVNGKVMTADAAPYLNEAAATTMVPAVFFTKAFGITATPLYDENGVCDVLFSK